MDPTFLLDLRDAATGKQVAVRLDREQALAPLDDLLAGVLRACPEDLAAEGRIAPAQADTLFRLQDLFFPVDDAGRLAPTPYTNLVWRRGRDGTALDPFAPALFDRLRQSGGPDLLVLALEADRHDLPYARNWRGFHARRAARFRPVLEQIEREALPEGILLDSAAAEQRYIEAVAKRVWDADFENYSRFLFGQPGGGGVPLKTGDETLESIVAGRGGVCTEKVLALKLLTDARGIESRPVFAGPHTRKPLPAAELRVMLNELATYDFTFARRYMRYWDHIALQYRLADGARLIVDPSNGNIPFLCAPAEPYLVDGPSKVVTPVRMLAVEEPVWYHETPEQLGLDFLFAWETWITDVDLMQVFENRIGLITAREFYVTPAMWGSTTKRAANRRRWQEYAEEHGLGCGFLPANGDHAPVGAWADFERLNPEPARWCRASVPGLERRYRHFILAAHGIDKPFHADLVVLDRRPLLKA